MSPTTRYLMSDYIFVSTQKRECQYCADVGRDDDDGVNLSLANAGWDVVGSRALILNPSEFETRQNWSRYAPTLAFIYFRDISY